MDNNADRDENIKKLHELIKDIRFAMLTTIEEDGTLRSRPMATQEFDFDGDLWFFTYGSAHKVEEVQHNQHVNISYAEPKDQKYVSVSGTAQLVRDRQKIEDLWNPLFKAWFAKGLDEPDLALLKLTLHRPSGRGFFHHRDSQAVPLRKLYTVCPTATMPLLATT